MKMLDGTTSSVISFETRTDPACSITHDADNMNNATEWEVRSCCWQLDFPVGQHF